MKLRIRSLESKETLRIEVPTPCSLQHLKDIISQRVSSSSAAPASLYFSLNRKDELGSSSQDSLQSVGICSGDLIFFTINPDAFSSEFLNVQSNSNPEAPKSSQPLNSPETVTPEPNSEKERTLDHLMNTQKEDSPGSESGKNETEPLEVESLGSETQLEGTRGMPGTVNMDIDDDASAEGLGKSFSVPSFLRRVFREEVGEGGGGDRKLLVIAVHAVLLESGFVGFDSVSKMKVERFHLPDEWPSSAFSISLWYTLPEIIDHSPFQAVHGVETVVLKFLSVGKYVNIYGSLANNGSATHRVCLDEGRLTFLLNLMWANYGSVDETKEQGIVSNISPEREVFEFWKTVKDRLALPLLIDLCERAGLAPPPCFMRLPTELKLMILEPLCGVDVARVGCVCSELRYLCSNDYLWKQKFVEQFGDAVRSEGESNWKQKFAQTWENKKRRRTAMPARVAGGHFPLWVPRTIRNPYPLRVPRMIGGDYDIGPSSAPRLSGHGFPSRNVIPRCDLGRRIP